MQSAAVSTDPDATVRILFDGANAVLAQRAGVALQVCERKGIAVARVEPRQAVVAAGPEEAAGVLHQHINVVGPAVIALLEPVVAERSGSGIEPAQACAAGTRPDEAVLVDEHAPHRVAADTGGVLWIMAPGPERLGLAIVANEPAAARSEPEVAGVVFGNVEYEVVAERIGIAALAFEMSELVAVVAVQAIFGANPDVTRRILPDGQHRALRQAVIERQVIETHRVTAAGGMCRCGKHQRKQQRRCYCNQVTQTAMRVLYDLFHECPTIGFVVQAAHS